MSDIQFDLHILKCLQTFIFESKVYILLMELAHGINYFRKVFNELLVDTCMAMEAPNNFSIVGESNLEIISIFALSNFISFFEILFVKYNTLLDHKVILLSVLNLFFTRPKTLPKFYKHL